MNNNTLLIVFLLIVTILSCTSASCSSRDSKIDDNTDKPIITTNDFKYLKKKNYIRLLTYNVFYGKSNTQTPSFSEENIQNISNVIKTLDADVVSVQELDSGAIDRNKRYLLDDIRHQTNVDYDLVFSHAAIYNGGTVGCGVLFKKDLNVNSIEKIPLPGKEKRVLLILVFDKFVFMATHLDLDDNLRMQSATIINDLVKKYNKPVFLAGDLNDSHLWKNGGFALPILQQQFVIKSSTEGTLPNQPNQVIDYILLSKSGEKYIKESESVVLKRLYINSIVTELNSFSDHYPVFLDVKIE